MPELVDAHRPPRRRPTIAKAWQLVVLKKLQSESENPTEEQRLAVAAETGLDEKWVKNWFVRQRSKLAARNRKDQPAGLFVTVPMFKVQLCQPSPRGTPSRRSVSTPIDPTQTLLSPASLESRSLCPSPSTADTQTIPRSRRSVSAPVSLDSPSQNASLATPTPSPTKPTYSRDPLCNRYPDFSQFFRPRVHERFNTFQLSTPISNYNHLVQLAANPNVGPHAPVDWLELVCPPNVVGLPVGANLHPCPVSFTVRLADLMDNPLATEHSVLPFLELAYPI